MIEPNHSFKSVEEERDYYKKLAITYEKKYQETKLDLEEFQESSRELEAELEAQLEQTESRNKELKSLSSRFQLDCESLKDKLQALQVDSKTQIADLEDELNRTRATRDDLQKYIRELEQLNDDLERAKRAAVSSLEDFEARLNQAIERNAFLESELDEKEVLKVTVQRLKDESRDLRQEMTLHQRPVYERSASTDTNLARVKTVTDTRKIKAELENLPEVRTKYLNNHLNTSSPLTPSSRISSLNIIGDLLRKVGALESKLASCRAYVKENSPKEGSEKQSPVQNT
ncbi:nuclear distribution protein nudE homolog 1 isoform X2 [Parasteatoda tepidariorum]|uniref:nuclear distribution protein nudE homolog 1 isoform X2 n=1 Tax=Parasteatoda tepidariorum TaxID=114398 RepID=UPI00077F9135|nr:nuclear distribution protein nudE homolog 1 isoform X2 [Parasteatoda tepidariorum]